MLKRILHELKHHFWYSFAGVFLGSLLLFFSPKFTANGNYHFFYFLHPMHVFFSAYATVSLYKIIHKDNLKFWQLSMVIILAAYLIPVISDSLIPYLGESLLKMPFSEAHIGFLEEPLIVNGVVLLGVLVGWFRPVKYIPHFIHIFVSSLASVFHVLMASAVFNFDISIYLIVFVFLIFAVWIPCATGDVVIPLIFKENKKSHEI